MKGTCLTLIVVLTCGQCISQVVAQDTESGDSLGATARDRISPAPRLPGETEAAYSDRLAREQASTTSSLVGQPISGLVGVEPAFDPNQARGQRLLVCVWDWNQRPSRRMVQELAQRTDALKAGHIETILIQIAKTDPAPLKDWLRERDVPFFSGMTTEDEARAKARWAVDALPWLILTDPNHLVRAEGFSLGPFDAALKAGDLGVLPSRPAPARTRSVAERPAEPQVQDPNWQERFNQVYRLDGGQVLKRIAPPFIPQRDDSHVARYKSYPMACLVFHWDGRLQNWGESSGSADLRMALSFVLGLSSWQFEGPDDLLSLPLPGDWIVRKEASVKERLQALEQILSADEGRKIRFERRTADREVIVAKGLFDFHPPEGTYNDAWLHMFSDVLDERESSGGGHADSVSKILQVLGDRVGMPVIDRTEPVGTINLQYGHHRSSRLREIQDATEKSQKLHLLLTHLTQQTDLRFTIERQPVEVWFVSER